MQSKLLLGMFVMVCPACGVGSEDTLEVMGMDTVHHVRCEGCSGDYFVANQNTSTNTPQTAIVGTRTPNAKHHGSITVMASLCAVADALTKVLWLSGIDSAVSRALLDKYAAEAVALDMHGVATYA